jgi:hypothetical protein
MSIPTGVPISAHHAKDDPPDLLEVLHAYCASNFEKAERQVRFCKPSDRPAGRSVHNQPEQAEIVILCKTLAPSEHLLMHPWNAVITYRCECCCLFICYGVDLLEVWVNSGQCIVHGTLQI